MKTSNWTSVAAIALLLTATPVAAQFVYTEFGTAAPPSSLGAYQMVQFTPDPTALGSWVSSVALPAGATPSGSLVFDQDLSHWTVGPGASQWATWSHGYTGDVYGVDVFLSPDDVYLLSITLPAETKAFYFYMEPGPFDDFGFTILPNSNLGLEGIYGATINGDSGAQGFGFHVTDPTLSVHSIVVMAESTWPDGFAVGEFAINGTASVPDGTATALLLGIPLLALAILRRRFC